TYAVATTPGMVFQAPDGRFGAMNNDEDDSQCAVNNPISRAHRVDGNIRKNNLRTRFVATVRPYKGVSITGSYSYEFLNEYRRRKPVFVKGWNFLTETPTYDSTSKASITNYNGRTERFFNDLVANYDGKFVNDKLGVNVMLGTSHELYRSGSFSASKQDPVDLSLWALSACTGDASASGSTTEWAMNSYFGRINLNWDEKYLLEFNLRADGSSRFLDGKRWGWFPSGSAAWRMEQEPFMESLVEKGLNNLKIRASYGALGNNSVGNYDALALYTNAESGYELAYSLNGLLATGLAQVALPNPLLTWESTKITDVGVDFGLFRNRLSVTADYFYKRTSNILINLPAPDVHGTTSIPKVNSAEVVNKGIEITAGWMDSVRDFKYGVNVNFTYVTNKVTKFKGKDKDGMSISGTNLIWEGHPINTQYMLVADRIIQTEEDMKIVNDMIENAPVGANGQKVNPFASYGTPKMGDLLYKDVNGDGIINADDRTIVADGPNPKYMLGLNLTAEWKGIDFSVLFQGSFGAKRYWQSTGYNTPTVRKGYQINKEVAEGAWREGRTDATYPRLLYYEDKINQQASTFYLSSLDFLKVR
ncbi:MAG: SusC/RagA family TonB-linked outer membrane protein, partial [Muribaculaceae bacterium]|nr:SusC/RagA family TonB-linked outer membrane protein [Muribaculaceae bacterium]